MPYSKTQPTIFLLLLLIITPTANAQTIRFAGPPVLYPFIRSVAKTYSDVSFDIMTIPYDHKHSIFEILNKTDILGMADEIHPEIILMDAQKHLIGKDAIAIFVNKKNPIADLTLGQLKEVYSGKAILWHEFVDFDYPISIFTIHPCSPGRQTFKSLVLPNQDYHDNLIHTVKRDSLILKFISENPGGIAFLTLSDSIGHKSLPFVKTVSINGQIPSIKNTAYPITLPLYLVTRSNTLEKEARFINWVLSTHGQKIVRKFFIGFSPFNCPVF